MPCLQRPIHEASSVTAPDKPSGCRLRGITGIDFVLPYPYP